MNVASSLACSSGDCGVIIVGKTEDRLDLRPISHDSFHMSRQCHCGLLKVLRRRLSLVLHLKLGGILGEPCVQLARNVSGTNQVSVDSFSFHSHRRKLIPEPSQLLIMVGFGRNDLGRALPLALCLHLALQISCILSKLFQFLLLGRQLILQLLGKSLRQLHWLWRNCGHPHRWHLHCRLRGEKRRMSMCHGITNKS